MTYRLRWLLCFFIAQLLLITGPGRANDGPIHFISGGASPLTSPHHSIRMDSEEVTIRLHKNSYTVDAVFHFFNTGDTLTQWVGFPRRSMGYDFVPAKAFIRFETWVNDEKVPFFEKQDRLKRLRMFLNFISSDSWSIQDDRWLVKQVTFPSNATTTTRVCYEAEYHWSYDANTAFYIYGTGSYWKDTIGKARFTIDGTEIGGAKRFSVKLPEKSQFSESENEVTHEFRNIEPKPDDYLTVAIPR